MIEFSLRAYRWLLHLYPQNFRAVYGDEMLHVFRDCCLETYQDEGSGGILRLWLASLGDLLLNVVAEHLVQLRRNPMTALRENVAPAALFGTGLMVLGFTWFFLFIWFAAATEGLLAPWDTAPGRPELGQWDRTLNDFFETMPGAFLPGVIVVGLSLWMFVRALRQQGMQPTLPWMFIASNILYVAVSLVAVNFGHGIMNTLLPYNPANYDHGYHRSLLPFALNLITTIGLLMVQARFRVMRKQRLVVG